MQKTFLYIAILLILPFSASATELLNEAQSAFQRLQIPKAESIYNGILDDSKSDAESRYEAHLGLARIKHSVGRSVEAKDEIRKAVKIAGWKKLLDEDYPPSFIEIYEATRKEETKESGSLAVTSEPPFAQIKVQGLKVGFSPLTIPDLPSGTYEIEVSLSGYTTKKESVSISKGNKRLLAFDLLVKKEDVLTKAANNVSSQVSSQNPKSNVALNIPKSNIPAEKNKDRWWEGPVLWGSAAVLVGGIAAFVFYKSGEKTPTGSISVSLP